MAKNLFNLICIEGADKCGKTTLSNRIRSRLGNVKYYHFTTSIKKNNFTSTDVTLQKNVNVFFQFYKFFKDKLINFYTPDETFLLDRVLYSDILYGPIYRGNNDDLIVRKIESNFFTLMLESFQARLIFADNMREADGYKNIQDENEGVITSDTQYSKLRWDYRTMINQLRETSDLDILDYDYNNGGTDKFIDEQLIPSLEQDRGELFNKLIGFAIPAGQFVGTTKITKDTPIFRLDGPYYQPITIQDYAEVVMSTGSADYTKDSPIINNNRICLIRKGTDVEDIIDNYLSKI